MGLPVGRLSFDPAGPGLARRVAAPRVASRRRASPVVVPQLPRHHK
ncbi:hypothetical protein ACFQVC_34135 [Streptomyces monticola]|uniref:Uncharacterized protein n=1 Tax=Streptomyces monticola TaxID=2666263 RepID=A0ABW2JSS2_9ACTN